MRYHLHNITLKHCQIAAAILCLYFPTLAVAEQSKCSDQNIVYGIPKEQVLALCGTPFLIDKWQISDQEKSRTANGAIIIKDKIKKIERITFNFGQSNKVVYVQLSNGFVKMFEQGAYGIDTPVDSPKQAACINKLDENSTKIEVIAACGQPSYQDQTLLKKSIQASKKQNRKGDHYEVTNSLDTWVYNFGPKYSRQYIKFKNGNIVRVVKGDRG